MSEEWSRQVVQPKPEGTLSKVSESSSLSNGSTLAQSDNGAISHLPERKRWRYELDWESKAEDEEPILVQKVCLRAPVFDQEELISIAT